MAKILILDEAWDVCQTQPEVYLDNRFGQQQAEAVKLLMVQHPSTV